MMAEGDHGGSDGSSSPELSHRGSFRVSNGHRQGHQVRPGSGLGKLREHRKRRGRGITTASKLIGQLLGPATVCPGNSSAAAGHERLSSADGEQRDVWALPHLSRTCHRHQVLSLERGKINHTKLLEYGLNCFLKPSLSNCTAPHPTTPASRPETQRQSSRLQRRKDQL